MNKLKSPVLGYVFIGVGCVLAGIGVIWGVFIGFYSSDLPLLLGLLVVGLLAMWVGQRITQAAKQDQVRRRIEERNAGGG